jgi:hypothetical protein
MSLRFPSAKSQFMAARRLRSEIEGPNALLRNELEALLEELDAARGSRPGFELPASLICWQVAEGGPVRIEGGGLTDSRLKGKIAFVVARSMLSAGNTDGAAHFVNVAEELFSKVGYRENASQILGLRANVALKKNDSAAALKLYRQALTAGQEVDD